MYIEKLYLKGENIMATRIGHASIDENGRASGGAAGDQTGREVYKQDWWNNGWTVMLRAKSLMVSDAIALACEAGCDNNKIGYDQGSRNTLRTQAQKVGFDLTKITTACECDCSSFAAVCAEAAGVNMNSAYTSGNAPTTSNMRSKFVGTGAFNAYTDSKYLRGVDDLQRGDILVKEGSHAVIVLTNGKNIKVQTASNPINNNMLYYKAHVRTYGTLPTVRDGQIAGTVGRRLRMEAFWLDLTTIRKTYPNLKLSGSVHVENEGDKNFSNIENSTCLGTTAKSLRLEAFLLNATGLPSGKKLYYRAHVEDAGWESWKTSGQWAGTKGKKKQIEAIQIYIA